MDAPVTFFLFFTIRRSFSIPWISPQQNKSWHTFWALEIKLRTNSLQRSVCERGEDRQAIENKNWRPIFVFSVSRSIVWGGRGLRRYDVLGPQTSLANGSRKERETLTEQTWMVSQSARQPWRRFKSQSLDFTSSKKLPSCLRYP